MIFGIFRCQKRNQLNKRPLRTNRKLPLILRVSQSRRHGSMILVSIRALRMKQKIFLKMYHSPKSTRPVNYFLTTQLALLS